MANGDLDLEEIRDRIHQAVYQTLIDKIRRDRFPSATMMNLVEANLSEEQFREYVGVLLEKVRRDRYPSMDMLKRLTQLV
jgi:hypothetical protein